MVGFAFLLFATGNPTEIGRRQASRTQPACAVSSEPETRDLSQPHHPTLRAVHRLALLSRRPSAEQPNRGRDDSRSIILASTKWDLSAGDGCR